MDVLTEIVLPCIGLEDERVSTFHQLTMLVDCDKELFMDRTM